MLNKLKNSLIRSFIFFIKRYIPINNSKNVLIVSTTGLGDTLWATPAIRALKKNNPDLKLFVLTTSFGKTLLQNNPYIEEIILIKKNLVFSFFSLLFTLRKKKISIVYLFHFSQRPILPICALIGALKIIGTEKINKGMDFLLTHSLTQKKMHEIDRRLEIVGCNQSDRWMDFFFKDESPFDVLDSKKQSVCFHPGAKDRYKCWPKEYFIETALKLQLLFPLQIFISGGSDEKDLIDSLHHQIPGSIALKETLSLREFASILKNMDLLITNDTGPMHLACALTIPVIAPFSPTDAIFCGPVSKNTAIALTKKRSCNPCLKRKCLEPFCLSQISPSDVIETASKILSKNQ